MRKGKCAPESFAFEGALRRKKSSNILRWRKAVRFDFINCYQGTLSKEHLCKLFNVTSPGLRAHRHRPISLRQRNDMVLLAHIRNQHSQSLNSYGRPRMTEELKELGLKVSHRRVGRLMRQNNITVIRTRKHEEISMNEGDPDAKNLIGSVRVKPQTKY